MSGGQTGVDRAALDAAIEFGLPHGGWCPKGRRADGGVIPGRYRLRETPSAAYQQRTEWNVRDSDATVALYWGEPSGGTRLTIERARALGKPIVSVDLASRTAPGKVAARLQALGASVLNVAGPRESLRPGQVYGSARRFLDGLFTLLATSGSGERA